MIQFQVCFILSVLLLLNPCNKEVGVQDMKIPAFSESDTIYHGIFMPWDGIWEGTFEIFSDPNGQKEWEQADLTMADTFILKKYQRTGVVQVRQMYESITPYYQLVEITDTYIEAEDTIKTTSKGVNKVQGGQIWCIIEKPDELVIHHGRKIPPNSIIWSRNKQAPLRKEYFLESIFDNTYQIIGYGYYEGDKPDLSPKMWFLATYHHISDYIR